ncbi:MAG: zf-HC2 domain-containing protein [Clostridia bacterium]|nr:zf-HC2 domain-containing protein [Clostridia bacterium]
MDKKTECEIVQDLLLGYVDKVLNNESKKLVDKHLIECEICKAKLDDINQDISQDINNQKKQIDYLKKVRRKNNIKIVISVFGIIFLIFSIIFLRKFLILNDLSNKEKIYKSSENMYIEEISKTGSDFAAVRKIYYKDGKYKEIRERYDNGEIIKENAAGYGSINSDEKIEINHDTKKAYIEKGGMTKVLNEMENVKHTKFYLDIPLRLLLGRAFNYSIHTSTRTLGREYYVLKDAFNRDEDYEVWIDKENGLALKVIDGTTVRTFYDGTDIEKEENKVVYEYRYKFDIVKDEDVNIPDYTGYEIIHTNTDFPEK